MVSYQDIRVLENPVFGAYTFMAALYGKLHMVLSLHERHDIGISFPEYGITPGDVIRLHGSSESLEKLHNSGWLNGICDACSISDILPVPEGKIQGWRSVHGVMAQSDKAELVERRGLQQSHDIFSCPACSLVREAEVPSILIKEPANGEPQRLFIIHGLLEPSQRQGSFTFFGFSQAATIPWF